LALFEASILSPTHWPLGSGRRLVGAIEPGFVDMRGHGCFIVHSRKAFIE
jgi:hypothetical protein